MPEPSTSHGGATDEVSESLDAVAEAAEENAETSRVVAERARELAVRRRTGRPYRDVVADAPRPLVAELLSRMIHRLYRSGSRLRRAEARILHEEGLTMEEIGSLFGVSRQRVSRLVRESRRGR